MDDARQGPGLQPCAMTECRHSDRGFVVPFARVSVSRRRYADERGDR
jgi:hypothetical protein